MGILGNKLYEYNKKKYLFYQGYPVLQWMRGQALEELFDYNGKLVSPYIIARAKKDKRLYNPAEQVGSGKKSRKLRGGVQFRYNWDYYDKYK